MAFFKVTVIERFVWARYQDVDRGMAGYIIRNRNLHVGLYR
jgi:hypothetical protein